MKVTLCGALKCAMFARANSRSSLYIGARALPENNEGVRRLAPALMRQPNDRHLLHSGCRKSTPSTSTEEMFSPPLMMTSFRRSRIST